MIHLPYFLLSIQAYLGGSSVSTLWPLSSSFVSFIISLHSLHSANKSPQWRPWLLSSTPQCAENLISGVYPNDLQKTIGSTNSSRLISFSLVSSIHTRENYVRQLEWLKAIILHKTTDRSRQFSFIRRLYVCSGLAWALFRWMRAGWKEMQITRSHTHHLNFILMIGCEGSDPANISISPLSFHALPFRPWGEKREMIW